jgi:hypothetical protein
MEILTSLKNTLIKLRFILTTLLIGLRKNTRRPPLLCPILRTLPLNTYIFTNKTLYRVIFNRACDWSLHSL